jgi:menaquinone-dependent protoporphyrinogen IX oxidase
MDDKLITCPETGHLEQVEIERTSVGLVVVGCSRLRRDGESQCARECTRRLDCRERIAVEDRDRVLLVLAGFDDATAPIAAALADELKQDGFVLELATIDSGALPPLADYDAVVIGVPDRPGRVTRAVTAYVRERREALAGMPAFLFAVSDNPAFDAEGYVARLAQRTGWRPIGWAGFADPRTVSRPKILDFAHRIADEVPVPALRPTMLDDR